MKSLGQKEYVFKFDDTLTSGLLVLMDQKIVYPWFINKKSFYTFYEPLAVSLNLTSGDLKNSIEITFS